MATNDFRFGDNQFHILKKILATLGGGISLTGSSTTIPVLDQGDDTVTQLVKNGLVDGFGRLRVSNPTTVLEAKHIGGSEPEVWSDDSSGHLGLDDLGNSQRLIQVNAGVTGHYTHQTFFRAYYQAGKSQLLEVTFNIHTATGVADRGGVEWEVGLGDEVGGVFVCGNGNPTGMNDIWFRRRRSALLEDDVVRADWNVDPLDGFGPSGKTLNMTAPQIFWADCEWLGVGQIRCGFVIDGERVHCHTFSWNNTVTSTNGTYMPSLTQPVRFRTESDGTTASLFTLACICCSVKSEGGQDNIGRDQVIFRSIGSPLAVNSANVWIPILGIRQVGTVPYRYRVIRPNSAEVSHISGNAAVEFGLFRNATPAGTAITWLTSGIDGAVEYFVNTTSATTVTGTPFEVGFLTGTAQQRSVSDIAVNPENQLGLSAAGTGNTLILAVRSPGTTASVTGKLGFRVAR